MAKSKVNKVLYNCFTGSSGQAAAEQIARDAKLGLDSVIATAGDVADLNYARKLLRSAGFEIVIQRKAAGDVVQEEGSGNAIDDFLEE